MTYEVALTDEAENDLLRLAHFLTKKSEASAAESLDTIERALRLLEDFPYSCRKASPETPSLRELIIPFGDSGYVALFRIIGKRVIILAIRHQREEDYQ